MIKKNKHIFLGLIPYPLVKGLVERFRVVGSILGKSHPTLALSLKKNGIDFTPEEYITYGLLNYFINGSVVAGLIVLIAVRFGERELNLAILMGLGTFLAIVVLFTLLLFRMPEIQAKSRAALTERALLFALQDLLLQINSGVTLYQALVSVSDSGYGEVSELFDYAARKVNTGTSMAAVIDEMLSLTDSEFLKRALWQMSASLRAGADLRKTLVNVIGELSAFQNLR